MYEYYKAHGEEVVRPEFDKCVFKIVIPPLQKIYAELSEEDIKSKSFLEILCMINRRSGGNFNISAGSLKYVNTRVARVIEFIGGILFESFIVMATSNVITNATDITVLTAEEIHRELSLKCKITKYIYFFVIII